MVTINTWFAVGSKDESPGHTGFAHLFEHLMFMGTERVPDNQFDMLMERGGGANNASTSNDRTNYYSWGPRSLLPTLLWLDADRLEGLSRAMTQEKLDLQRDVVRNERRQSYENQPYGPAELMVSAAMWPQGHPYHHPVIGSHEDLEAATVEDVKGFFDTYYVPGNASLVVAGDFDPLRRGSSSPPRSAPCPCGRCRNTGPRRPSLSRARCAAWAPIACASRACTWSGTRRPRSGTAMPTWTSCRRCSPPGPPVVWSSAW
ncbi:MAG: insulinase family protein [bacterium]|nr:insulinase family protein [bacterium]